MPGDKANDELVEGLMGLVHRLADMVLQLPADQRENAYVEVRDIGYRAGRGSGMSEEEARAAAENVVEWTRAFVRMVLAGGAGVGGTA